MDYEKKYKEALNWMRSIYSTLAGSDKEDAEHYFPELKESEDERIRKALIEVFKEKLERGFEWVEYGIPNRSVLSYLEKQKEQKPAEWNDTDMKEARDDLISVCRDWECGKQTTLLPIVALRARYFLEHLVEPKPADWSEEDEEILDGIINTLDRLGYAEFCKSSREEDIEEERFYYKEIQCLKKLKSLRPQPNTVSVENAIKFGNLEYERGVKDGIQNEKSRQWKPSEEQMEQLKSAADLSEFGPMVTTRKQFPDLASLYNDLKKLM